MKFFIIFALLPPNFDPKYLGGSSSTLGQFWMIYFKCLIFLKNTPLCIFANKTVCSISNIAYLLCTIVKMPHL